MNNLRHTRSQISKKILLQYFASIVAFIIVFAALMLLSWRITHSFVWKPADPLYIALHFIKEHLFLVMGLVLGLYWVIVTWYFVNRPLHYLDDLIYAAESLAHPSDTSIALPKNLKSIEDEMNLIRERALRNILLAKEAEKSKNDLIVHLAHDLKTPLTSVIGYLNLLRDAPELSEHLMAKYTTVALNKAEQLEDLINSFFEITRFNLTTMTLDAETVNLSRMLEQIADEYSPILNEKHLSWKLDIHPHLEITCDALKMGRVFDNVIRNAIHYGYEGSELFLSLAHEDGQIRFILENAGKTIPPEKIKYIFDAFYRIDPSRSSKDGNAGLGLAIAKAIVQLHGGTISITSANERITVTVALPSKMS